MNITPALVGLALYILVWQKLPEWGTLFTTVLSKMPQPVQTLYKDWQCPYCVGFWLGLSLHAATGIWTLPALAELPAYWGITGLIIAWFFDALVTGTLILMGKLAIDAVSFVAIKGVVARTEFMAQMKSSPIEEDSKI